MSEYKDRVWATAARKSSPVIRHGLINKALHHGYGAVGHIRTHSRATKTFDGPFGDCSGKCSSTLADNLHPDFIKVTHAGFVASDTFKRESLIWSQKDGR